MRKKPGKGVFVPPVTKIPRGAEIMESIRRKLFCWRLGEIDWDGPWGWEKVELSELIRVVIPKLHDYESMTWAEVEGPSGSHAVGLDQVCSQAQTRLEELGKGELETLFSVRITGERRVWGVKDVAILRVLWWDPNHSVCPSIKKHT
jgi:hypothetical protein